MPATSLSTHYNLFVTTTSPRRYVPRAATEAALVWLERRIYGEAAAATLVTGAPGMGKSMLLRVFAQRMRDRFRSVAIPGLDTDAATLCTMLLDLLKVPPGADPEQTLLFHAAQLESRGSALLVLIDDVHRLPLATAGRLGALAETSGGLRIVAATVEVDPALARALGANATVALRTPMDPGETLAFVKAALAASWATPETRALYDRTTIARIHHEAQGVPGEVNRLAAAIADGAVRDGFVAEPGRGLWRDTTPRRTGIVPL